MKQLLKNIRPLLARLLTALHLNAFHPALITLILLTLAMVPVCAITGVSNAMRALNSSAPAPSPEFTLGPVITDTPVPTDTKTPLPTRTYTHTPALTFTPSSTPTVTLPAAQGANCVPAENDREEARVIKITDGDTIVVDIGGTQYKLRYIGIDAPESSASGGNQSTEYNRKLVEGKTVTLVRDQSWTDRYDRLLRYVFVGDTFVNYEMVRAGYATSGSWPPDTACDQVFASVEQSARLSHLGLWVPTITPVPYVPPTAAPTNSGLGIIGGGGANCSPAYPDVCIPPPPPDLNCKDVPYKRFRVLSPDPHNFDGDGDGIGCEG